jgi:hypothetical protein
VRQGTDSSDHAGVDACDPSGCPCLPHIIALPIAAQRLDASVALVPDQCRSLLDDLAQIADPRQQRGRRHALGALLAVAGAAARAFPLDLRAASLVRPGWLVWMQSIGVVPRYRE